jgi:DNA-binding transcriptional MerR regulator
MPKQTKGRMRETWRDWQDPKAPDPGMLLTRDEFVQVLQSEEIDATEQDLLYWQKIGVIPYPELKRAGRVGHAHYPFWMVHVVRLLRKLQAAGMTLEEMDEQLRETARFASVADEWRPSEPETTELFLGNRLSAAVSDMARVYTKATEIEARITDERGSVHYFKFPFSGSITSPIIHERFNPPEP